MKIRIYQPQELNILENIKLNKRNTHYLSKVLRIKIGEKIIIFNGDGYNYVAEIKILENKIFAKILQIDKNISESSLNITLIQAIGKGDKMDFIVQKATELGVNKIIPIITQRTIYKSSKKDIKKVEKWQEIAINAAEQCGRSVVPQVENITKFNDLQLNGVVFMLDILAIDKLTKFDKSNDINIIIGPEGGFSGDELNNNYHKLSLGSRVLRTETAGLSCLANLELLWG